MLLIFLIPELLLLFFPIQDSLNSFPFKTFDFAGECGWRVQVFSAGGEI